MLRFERYGHIYNVVGSNVYIAFRIVTAFHFSTYSDLCCNKKCPVDLRNLPLIEFFPCRRQGARSEVPIVNSLSR